MILKFTNFYCNIISLSFNIYKDIKKLLKSLKYVQVQINVSVQYSLITLISGIVLILDFQLGGLKKMNSILLAIHSLSEKLNISLMSSFVKFTLDE